jgi:ribosomal protein S18 acetylase RimI-like enzyme
VIRSFRPDDAPATAELLAALVPANIHTAESLEHRHGSEPERARRRSWVARDGGEIVGFATAWFQWFGGEAGKGRICVGVREDRRKRGMGTRLWDAAVAHLAGATKLTVEVDDDHAGLRFVERRGFTQYSAEVISSLDLRARSFEPEAREGFRVVSLREASGREEDLFEFYGRAGGLPPGDPKNRVTFDEWRRFILGNPLLNRDASVLVTDAEGRIVSLSWLLVDRTRRRAENEWTATLPELRGRGLARLAKTASIRAAIERGIDEIVTGNEPDNLPMRALNRRLGYSELFTRRDLERPIAQRSSQ